MGFRNQVAQIAATRPSTEGDVALRVKLTQEVSHRLRTEVSSQYAQKMGKLEGDLSDCRDELEAPTQELEDKAYTIAVNEDMIEKLQLMIKSRLGGKSVEVDPGEELHAEEEVEEPVDDDNAR